MLEGTNSITNTSGGNAWNCGIYVAKAHLTIQGGSLEVKGDTGYTSHGICVHNGTIPIENGQVTTIAQSAGVPAAFLLAKMSSSTATP